MGKKGGKPTNTQDRNQENILTRSLCYGCPGKNQGFIGLDKVGGEKVPSPKMHKDGGGKRDCNWSAEKESVFFGCPTSYQQRTKPSQVYK